MGISYTLLSVDCCCNHDRLWSWREHREGELPLACTIFVPISSYPLIPKFVVSLPFYGFSHRRYSESGTGARLCVLSFASQRVHYRSASGVRLFLDLHFGGPDDGLTASSLALPLRIIPKKELSLLFMTNFTFKGLSGPTLFFFPLSLAFFDCLFFFRLFSTLFLFSPVSISLPGKRPGAFFPSEHFGSSVIIVYSFCIWWSKVLFSFTVLSRRLAVIPPFVLVYFCSVRFLSHGGAAAFAWDGRGKGNRYGIGRVWSGKAYGKFAIGRVCAAHAKKEGKAQGGSGGSSHNERKGASLKGLFGWSGWEVKGIGRRDEMINMMVVAKKGAWPA